MERMVRMMPEPMRLESGGSWGSAEDDMLINGSCVPEPMWSGARVRATRARFAVGCAVWRLGRRRLVVVHVDHRAFERACPWRVGPLARASSRSTALVIRFLVAKWY